MGQAISKLVFKSSFEKIPDPPSSFFNIKMNDLEGNLVDFN